jgi:hypothetical protein
LALAERFAQAGLDVVLADVERPALQAAEQKVAGLGAKTLAVPTDVSDEAAVKPSRTVPALSPAHHMRGSPGPSTRSWSAPSVTASAALDDLPINMISF